jgi:hypothetical protein
LPAVFFGEGMNQISVVSRVPGDHVGQPPYLLLAEAALATMAGTGTEVREAAALSSGQGSGQGNNSGPGGRGGNQGNDDDDDEDDL